MKDHYDFSKGKRGAVLPTPGKERITIRLDADILDSSATQSTAPAAVTTRPQLTPYCANTWTAKRLRPRSKRSCGV
jgi:hypothetical protein